MLQKTWVQSHIVDILHLVKYLQSYSLMIDHTNSLRFHPQPSGHHMESKIVYHHLSEFLCHLAQPVHLLALLGPLDDWDGSDRFRDAPLACLHAGTLPGILTHLAQDDQTNGGTHSPTWVDIWPLRHGTMIHLVNSGQALPHNQNKAKTII